ncbi:MAG TPA: hypothetical protein VEW69_02010 [Alphaproteobacteria bacterium]|nr:hypothetical protein [Alphaproteobacteria bacterium]
MKKALRYSLGIAVLLLGAATTLAAQTAKAQPKPPRPAARPTRVLSAKLRVVPVRYTGACPGKFKFIGLITTDGAGPVKYTWASFDGGTWPEQTITFSAKGTKNVMETREMGAAGQTQSGWMQLKVLSPNTLQSTQARFQVACGARARRK